MHNFMLNMDLIDSGAEYGYGASKSRSHSRSVFSIPGKGCKGACGRSQLSLCRADLQREVARYLQLRCQWIIKSVTVAVPQVPLRSDKISDQLLQFF